MPKLKPGHVFVSDAEDAAITAAALSDPDAMPFTDAQWARIKPLVRRGRPLGSGTKTQVTIRLDTAIVEKFKATGDGWQTRINALLRDAVARGQLNP
jgi:uncharacterized protein (DUF4415 family)